MSEYLCETTVPPCAEAETIPPGTIRTVWLSGSLTLKLVWCPPGEFWMGSPNSESGRSRDEPRHRVTLSHGFWLGQYQVTQEQYEEVMLQNPSYFRKKNAPADSVSYPDALLFCRQLTIRERNQNRLADGLRYTLPTEAQWEYACRAGTDTVFHYGDVLDSHMANFDGHRSYNADKSPYRQRTCPVGTFAPNSWGLFDMYGNIWEWCLDGYEPYRAATERNPLGTRTERGMVRRGGSWGSGGTQCRSAARSALMPIAKCYYQGFRVALCGI